MIMESGCEECEALTKTLEHSEENCLTLNVPSSIVCFPAESKQKEWKFNHRKGWKTARDNFLLKLKKYICALRNSKGGVIIVHITELDPKDRYLDYFHELVDERLNGMIEDGSLFVTVYRKDWVSKEGENNGFVRILVSASVSVVTLDFKTKLPLDNCIVDPSNTAILNILSEEIAFKDKTAKIRGPPNVNLTESRNLQVKVVVGENLDDAKTFAHYVWTDLRLREYVTVFSKIDGGGSFYAGIEEREKCYKKYISKELIRKSFSFTSSQEQFIETLQDKLRSEILIFSKTDKGFIQNDDLLETLIKIAFHPEEDHAHNYILEVAVAAVEGLVFYDRNGPESYKMDTNGNIVPIGLDDWYRRQMKALE